jgi:integral membrane protein
MPSLALRIFRAVSLTEGVSYLVLMFIAVPMKYLGNQPHAVQIPGSIHGGLFILFVLSLLAVWRTDRWSFGKVVTAFIASNIPFGAFWFEARLRKSEA